MIDVKRCTKCGEEKHLDAFGLVSKSPDGRAGQCRMCRNAAAAARYTEHRVDILAKAAARYERLSAVQKRDRVTIEVERRRLRKAANPISERARLPCGTAARYASGCRCPDCRAANAERHRTAGRVFECRICGNPFRRFRGRTEPLYCSKPCSGAAHRVPVTGELIRCQLLGRGRGSIRDIPPEVRAAALAIVQVRKALKELTHV